MFQSANLLEEFCSLLLPLDAILSHQDFHPNENPSLLLTTRFRNLWLLCALFGLTNAEKRPSCMTEWHAQALMRIAEKTPYLVLEESHDFVTAELEYNPILKQDYLQGVNLVFVSPCLR
jgi:phosphatidylinositol 4-kinase A